MQDWTSKGIASLLGAELCGGENVRANGCVIDSRQAKDGEIFFAFTGEKSDGHRYIETAWQNGAAVVVAEKKQLAELGLTLEPSANKALILVESSMSALQQLARAWRRKLGAKVVGITGSNGKTTTKDMVAAVLAQKYQVYYNKGNHNNELGLPMTILNAPEGTEVLVLEMGMRGLGEIKALCEIAQPDTGVITNIGTTHLELLGTQENIARAKWELIEALPPGGLAILNAEDKWSAMKAQVGQYNIRYYGLAGKYATPELQGSGLAPEGSVGTSFYVSWNTEKAEAHLPLPGEHNVLDALAALAVGTAYGVPLALGCEGLAGLRLSKMRLELLRGIFGSTLISDVYNANPASMRASLSILKERSTGPSVAILGEMYELGEASSSGHREVGEAAAQLGITELITVGAMAEEIARGALTKGIPVEGVHKCLTREEAVEKAKEVLARLPGAWVLIKASRGMKMEEVSARLEEL